MSSQDLQRAVSFWRTSAVEDRAVAESMHKLGHYAWSLFIWQTALEKLFKALIVQKGKQFFHTHMLEKLALQAGVELTDKSRSELEEITAFNQDARYDVYKLKLHKKATEEYANHWSAVCKNWFTTLEAML